MQRILTVALGVVIALAALAAASAQQEPPHRFYGTDGTAGDTIGVHENNADLTPLTDPEGNELKATVAEDGSWFIDVDRDEADDVVFSINGEKAEGETSSTGSGQTAVSGLAVVEAMLDEGTEDDDAMMDDGDSMMDGDDSMMDEDDDSMMDEDGDSMMDEDDSMMDEDGDSMMDDDDSMMDDGETGYPATGTGGLADGGVSAGLIGLLIAIAAVAVTGVGYRRIRHRA